MAILLYGYQGYIGSEIYQSIISKGKRVIGINRESFNESFNYKNIDTVIHCANSAKRYMANQNPARDRREIEEKVHIIADKHTDKNLILISSLSCRTELNTSYGQNREYAEKYWLSKGGLVIRLGPLYGGRRERDTLHDIAYNKHIYYSRNTKYAYANVKWAADYIADQACNAIVENKVKEIGARNIVTLDKIARYLKSSSTFSDKHDDQYPLNFKEGPDANDVLNYARSLKP